MITSVEILLCRWGRWATSGRSSGMGYPKASAIMRDAGIMDSYGSTVPYLDSSVFDVDAAVCAMLIEIQDRAVSKSSREAKMTARPY